MKELKKSKIKRLKDKTWRMVTIKIDKVVAQYKNNSMITNKPLYFLVEIDNGYEDRIMFRADTIKDLWEMIKQESFIYK